jgi:hypothetical protein
MLLSRLGALNLKTSCNNRFDYTALDAKGSAAAGRLSANKFGKEHLDFSGSTSAVPWRFNFTVKRLSLFCGSAALSADSILPDTAAS